MGKTTAKGRSLNYAPERKGLSQADIDKGKDKKRG